MNLTVSELINILKMLPQDAIVAVQYRDGGGYYSGCDYNITPMLTTEYSNGSEIVLL